MVNVRPDVRWLGFPLVLPEDSPGFLVDTDGPVRDGLLGNFSSGLLGFDRGARAAGAALSSQDLVREALDRLGRLYPDVGGRPFGFVDRQGLGTGPIVPVGDGSPLVATPARDPDPAPPPGRVPLALVPSSPLPSSPPSSMGTGRVGFPSGAMLPPSLTSQVAPAEPLRPPLPSGQHRPVSFGGPISGEGLRRANIGPTDPVAPDARPAFDAPLADKPPDQSGLQRPNTNPNVSMGNGSLSPRDAPPMIPEPRHSEGALQLRDHGSEGYTASERLNQTGPSRTTPNPAQYASVGSFLSFPRSPSRTDTSPGDVVVLPDGSTIRDSKSPTGKVMSPVHDLAAVAAKGRQAGATFRAMRSNPKTAIGARAYLAATLGLNVGQGGTHDHQRRGNRMIGYTQLRQFRPIANVNVGLFAQQAGLTLEETLDIAGTYARLLSSNVDPNDPYGLDARTRHFIERGYEIGQRGMFDSRAGNTHK